MLRLKTHTTDGYLASEFTANCQVTIAGRVFTDTRSLRAAQLPEAHKQTFLGFINGYREANGIGVPWAVRLANLNASHISSATEVNGEKVFSAKPSIAIELHAQHDSKHIWAEPQFLNLDNPEIIALYNYVKDTLTNE